MWRRSDFPGISIDIRGEDQLAISWLDVPFIRVKAHEFLQPESDFGRPHGLVGYTPGCTSRQPGWGWTQSSNPSPQAPHASSTQHCQTFYATMWCPNLSLNKVISNLQRSPSNQNTITWPITHSGTTRERFSPTCRHVIERGFDWRRANRSIECRSPRPRTQVRSLTLCVLLPTRRTGSGSQRYLNLTAPC